MAAPITSLSQTIEFERIVSVYYAGGELSITFADGQHETIPVERLADYGVRPEEWSSVEAEEFHVRVATAHGSVEIPWDALRYASSETFRHEWDDVMRHASKNAGQRFRTLREQRGVTIAQLAERVGTDVHSILDLESGSLSSNIDLERRILASLGCNRSDLRLSSSH